MPLITPLNLSEFHLAPEPPYFGPLWQQHFSELDGLDAGLVEVGAGQGALDVTAIAASIDTPTNAAAASLDAESRLADPPEVQKGLDALLPGDKGIDNSRTYIPGEGFQPVPRDLLPPPELGGFQPGQPGGGGGPGGGTGGGPPPPPGRLGPPTDLGGGGDQVALLPTVQVRNTTRPGATDFNEGDSFELDLKGSPNGAITASSTHNQVATAIIAFGVLTPGGLRTITGTMRAVDKGEWYENWYIDGVLALPVLHFFVN